ncbi:MAG TPA: hypothetical protein VMR31_09730 [Myxococcota bacterium]|nr:hypothetical protein [Myxococcota bacterium]
MNEVFGAYPTAPVALVLSVPMAFALFSALPPYRAAFLTLLVSALLLPVGYGFQLPGVTELDKSTLPTLAAILACVAVRPREFRYLRLRGWTLTLIAAFAAGTAMTASTNSDPYAVGGLILPALSPWDAVVTFRGYAIALILPFLLGRMLVREVAQLHRLLYSFVFAFLIYSLPMLWEVRMSPQLHRMVYGYLPSSFVQQIRGGGFRPIVFVGHGLGLAILTSFATLASTMLWRRGTKVRGLPPVVTTGYLAFMVALCKTLSAALYAGLGGLLMFLASAKAQLRAAVVIACVVLTYPMLRSFDLFPTSLLTNLSLSASEDRSESLSFRFENEDQLLEHARQRLLFGWGGYGRNRVFSDEGRDVSVTDGLWIIMLGDVGAVGFASMFGLMLLPIFQAGRALRNLRSPSDQRLLASCGLLIALNWADSLPNALSGGVLMLFMTGAFAGVVANYQKAVVPKREPRKAEVPAAAPYGSLQPLR